MPTRDEAIAAAADAFLDVLAELEAEALERECGQNVGGGSDRAKRG